MITATEEEIDDFDKKNKKQKQKKPTRLYNFICLFFFFFPSVFNDVSHCSFIIQNRGRTKKSKQNTPLPYSKLRKEAADWLVISHDRHFSFTNKYFFLVDPYS